MTVQAGEALFEAVHRQLAQHGYLARRGQIIDASIKKHGEAYFGYQRSASWLFACETLPCMASQRTGLTRFGTQFLGTQAERLSPLGGFIGRLMRQVTQPLRETTCRRPARANAAVVLARRLQGATGARSVLALILRFSSHSHPAYRLSGAEVDTVTLEPPEVDRKEMNR